MQDILYYSCKLSDNINDIQREKPQKRLTTKTFKNQILAASCYIIVYKIN